MDTTEILQKLQAEDNQIRKEGVALVSKVWWKHADEKNNRIEGREFTNALTEIIEKLLPYVESEKWYAREGAIRGLKEAAFSIDAKIAERVFIKCFERLWDSDGRVRNATVFALNGLRTSVSPDLYAETYLKLQDAFKVEKNKKVKDAIDRTLEKFSCPFLEAIMASKGYGPVEK